MSGGISGRVLFEACMAERLLNDIRAWDRRETREQFDEAEWVGFVAGLSDQEKRRWDAAASRISRAALRSTGGGDE